MVSSGKILPDKQVAIYPASAKLFFMGPDPPIKLSSSLHDGATDNYFREYRNEKLSRFIMPPYYWSEQHIPYSPKPNLSVKNPIDYGQSISMPPYSISTINAGRMKEVDDIYKISQMHRDQYKDRTGKLHPLLYFRPDHYNYQCAPGPVSSYFSNYPTSYTEYKIPVVLPLTYERRTHTPYRPNFSLSGIYSRSPCIAYKQ